MKAGEFGTPSRSPAHPRFAAGPGVIAGFLGMVLLLNVLLAIGTRDLVSVTEHEQSVAHTQEFLAQLEEALSLGLSSESGARGFVLTGDEALLEPYKAATVQLSQKIDALLASTADNPEQRARVNQLAASLARRLSLSDQSIEARRTRGFDAPAATLAVGEGKREMDRARAIKAEIEAVESDLLNARSADASRSLRTARLTLLATTTGGLFAVLWLALATERAARSRRAAAERNRFEKERFETTLLSIGDAVVVTDANAVITFMNRAGEQLTGWPGTEAIGRPLPEVFRIFNEHTRLPEDSPVDRVLRDGTTEGLANHTILTARDGRECAIDDSAAPIFDSDGRLSGAVLVFRDVAAQRAAAALIERQNRELSKASREKDEFVAQVSHELRTPINAILGWAKMLEAGSVPPERQPHAIAIIVQNALMQGRLIDDLIDLSRIVRGALSLDEQRIDDVAPIAAIAVDTMKLAASRKGVALETAFSPSGPVLGDGERLRQVCWNLLSNAVKFTPAGGTVTVSVRREGNRSVIAVADSGLGIEPGALPVIFNRFTQGNSGDIHRQGLGLGLAIAKELVQLHGGTIDAASDGPGRGATFTVTLPVIEAPYRREREGAERGEEPSRSD